MAARDDPTVGAESMHPAARWGLLLGGALSLQVLLSAAAGWHQSHAKALLFLLIAVLLNGAAIVLCLRETAAGRTWSGQLQNGLLVGAIAAAMVVTSQWFVTLVAYPDYFDQMAIGYRPALEEARLTAATIEAKLAGIRATTGSRTAVEGILGTMTVSTATAAIAGVWIRRR